MDNKYREINRKKDLTRFWMSSVPFLIFVFIMALLFFANEKFNWDYGQFGVYPREFFGLKGILFAPFIHGSIEHLSNNSIPILVLGSALLYFYGRLGIKVFFLLYFLTGFLVWISARESFHIGASGIVYALAAFLFLSGILRSSKPLIAISLLVAFLYGSLFWGIFPVKERVSWESHLWGGIAGFVLAIYYRKEGPQRKRFEWEDEEDDDLFYDPSQDLSQFDNEAIQNPTRPQTKIYYHYKKKDEE